MEVDPGLVFKIPSHIPGGCTVFFPSCGPRAGSLHTVFDRGEAVRR